MGIYHKIQFNIITPMVDWVTKWNIKSNIDFLLYSQWWSQDQINDYQCYKLNKLINHANKHSSYYKEIFKVAGIVPDDIKNLTDLKKIPVISKRMFRENYKNILCTNILSEDIINTATSGSTGAQLNYNITRQSYGMINSAAIRGLYWSGYKLGDKYIKISQNKRKSNLKKIQDYLNRSYLFAQSYTDDNFAKFNNILKTFRPKMIRSYPDPLRFFSIYLTKYNQSNVNSSVKIISTTGNTLFKEDRDIIESTFNLKIFDSYSCEGSAHANECPTHECYHLSDEYAITEIVDEKGNDVQNGERGVLVTTDLWNYVAPFIRYDTRDYVVKYGINCSCGRHLSAISRIEGRANDVLVTPGKQYLIGQTFTTQLKYFKGITQFQVIQEKIDSLKFKLQVTPEFKKQDEQQIINYWRNYTNNEMNIFIEIVDEIPPRKSGKCQFLVRNPEISIY